MIYPKFLNSDSCIGVSAVSMGVLDKKDSYIKSRINIEKYFKVVEDNNVMKSGVASNSGYNRAMEFNILISDDNIDMILCASGGEILIDMLPYIDTTNIINNPKWVEGYSDPSSLLYLITCKCDIATIYGTNAGSFDMDVLYPSLKYNIDLLKGIIKIQNSYSKYESFDSDRDVSGSYNLNHNVKWISNKNDINISGRLIGGCIDALNDIVGSYFDYTDEFIKKYYDDGFIWYFDIYSMSSIQLYRTLFHMKYTSWFKNCKCFIFGRVLIENNEFISYKDAIEMALGDIPYIMDADIGHTKPSMTLINGSYATIKYKDNKGSIEMTLK